MATLATIKEQSPITYQPLLLVEIQLVDGSIQYFSSHPLNTAEGGFAYGGHNYLARLSSQDLAQVQARSESGFDRIPTLSINLEDSDQTLWANYEMSGVGFRGGIMTARVVFWAADTTTFSDDSLTPFVGIIDEVRVVRVNRGDQIKLTANASGNLARSYLPVFPIQQRCAATFPPTAAARLAGATDMSSVYWTCGYNPDQTGTDPEIGGDCRRGNLNAGSPFTTCQLTVSDCQARGMYSLDSSSRRTGRYTGETFAPANRETQSKSYEQGKTVTVLNARNDAAYGEFANMVIGTQWVNAVNLQSLGDGNSTRGEYLICQDNIGPDGVLQVVLNGVIIPRNGSSPDNKLYRWNFCGDPTLGTPYATGSRNGVATKDALFDEQGNPHGSKAVIEIVTYSSVWQSGSPAQVRVLTQGPKIKTPNTANVADQGSWPLARSTNAAFVTLETLIWSNRTYADFDLQSFIDEAAYCDVAVSYTNFAGGTSSHPRFKLQFAIEKRRSAAEVVQALLRGFRAQLLKDPATGKYRLLIRKTLADQQPSPIAGSNYSTAVTSKTAAGTVANGYVAYKFDESNIARDNPDDPPFIDIYTEAASSTPNKIRVGFQDEENSYAQDSLEVSDVEAIGRAGGYLGGSEVVENSNIIGIPNFDQAFRILRTLEAERFRGNPAQDTRGTMYFSFRVDFRALHLRVGQLCLLTWTKAGITNQLVRIQSIKWGLNFEGAQITASWHSDDWYTDAYGQSAPPAGLTLGQTPNRLPYPWEPYGTQAISSDSVYGSPAGFAARSWWNFGLSQAIEDLSDNGGIVKLSVYGCPPVNDLSTSGSGGTKPPILGVQGNTATTGGTIPGGLTIYMAISAKDSSGKLTSLSRFAVVTTATGTNTNTITTPAISWQSGTSGYVLYAGTDELYGMTAQATGTGTPSTITITALNYSTYGPPDPLCAALNLRAKRLTRPGLWVDAVTAVAAGTLTFNPPSAFTTNQFVGCDVAMIAVDYNNEAQIPWANFRVTANDGNTLTVTPTPVGIVPVGSVVVCLATPGTFSDTTIGDSRFTNAYETGLVTTGSGHAGEIVRIIAGTGRGQTRPIASNTATVITVATAFNPAPDATSRFVIEEGSWIYDNDTAAIQAKDPAPATVPVVGTINAASFLDSTMLVEGNTVDAQGNYSPDPFAPLRMIWIHGKRFAGSAPGPIRDFQLQAGHSVDYTSEPGYVIIPLQYRQPIVLAGFSFIKLYVTADGGILVPAGEIPHPVGTSTVVNFTARVALSGANWNNAILWGTSCSPTYQNDLVTTGGAATPSFSIGSIPGYTPGGAPAAPEIPLGVALTILDREANFALQIAITPPSALGGTVAYEREVRYWNDAGLTSPDSDWIELGAVDTASATSVTPAWPRPAATQYVKARVRSVNADDVRTAWVETSTAQTLSTLALPPAIAANSSTVVTNDAGTVSRFSFRVSITPNASPGTTEWYEAQARYWNDSALTSPDSDWIPLGGFPPSQTTLDTDDWDRRPTQQWAKVRVAGKNANNEIGPWVESATLNIPSIPVADNATGVTSTLIDRGDTWGVSGTVSLPTSRTLLDFANIFIVGPISGSVDANTRRQVIGEPISIPSSGNITYATDGKWTKPLAEYGESTQTYRVDVELTDIYGNTLATVSSTTFTVDPPTFSDYSAISLSPDYTSIDSGNVRITGTATPPTDPLCDGVEVLVSRDGGTNYANEATVLKPAGSTSSIGIDFTTAMPSTSTGLKIKLVPTRSTGRMKPAASVTPVTVTVDPNSQPVSAFNGTIQATLPTTIAATPGSIGEQLIVETTNSVAGGAVLTWGSGFENPGMEPWPDASSRTRWTFVCLDRSGTKKWVLTNALFGV